ncbi:MAG: hypothetical protein QXJ96_02410 [Candidatus Aenigmatarchaeota archaeon]|nr:hypothetical protein [Candidatus Aenigmarchaeota archaeon]
MLGYSGFEIAILVLLAIALMHYTQLIKKNSKSIKWLVSGAASFIIASVLDLVTYIRVWITADGINYGHALFSIIGALLILVGGLKMIYELFEE